MYYVSGIVTGMAVVSWVFSLFIFPNQISDLEAATLKHMKAIQVLCEAAQDQFHQEHAYDIPLECDTLKRL